MAQIVRTIHKPNVLVELRRLQIKEITQHAQIQKCDRILIDSSKQHARPGDFTNVIMGSSTRPVPVKHLPK